MTTTTYPDGSSLVSSAISKDACQTLFQKLTAQMLGIIAVPWDVDLTLTTGQQNAIAASLLNLYAGLNITGPGITAGTTILGVTAPSTVQLSQAATQNGASAASVVDPQAYFKSRIGWQPQGQPAFGITDDIVIVRCVPIDTDYSRMRNVIELPGHVDDTTVTEQDIFTRQWRTYWTFYGPNALDRARIVRSTLEKVPFAEAALAASNLYLQPSIAEPSRVPEEYQGEWWERADLHALFNEQVTELYTVNAVASVEVKLYSNEGNTADFTVEP